MQLPNFHRAIGAVALAVTASCSGFLEVDNPNVLDESTIDPVESATPLSFAGQQSFQSATGWLNMYGAWFTGEALVSETFPTRNEFGRRDVAAANTSFRDDVWFPLSQAAASNHLVLELELPEPETNIAYVRTATWLGYSFLRMAENFCEGAVYGGPLLATQDMLDSAIANFTTAITIGTANASPDAADLANVALVGRARAYLQSGQPVLALADAQAVPAGFEYSFQFADDPENRTRLSNRMWQFTFDRGSISVAPAYQVDDPRVPYLAPEEHDLDAQDANAGPFFIQQKFPSYTAPMRVASKLEADYIAAEAQTAVEQLALIAARRAANGQPVYAGATDAASVLTELMRQKHLDFWLEGQRFGDFRRNPANVENMPEPGTPYFKPGFPPIGSQTCYPLPTEERDNNPNIPDL